MVHPLRRQIRDAFAGALAGTSFGANIFRGRTWPLDDASYPALLIYARGGSSQFDAMADRAADAPLARDERVVVEIALKAGGDDAAAVSLDDRIDALAAEVEAALMTDGPVSPAPAWLFGGEGFVIGSPSPAWVFGERKTFADILDELQLIGTEIDSAVGGDARRGSCRLVYRVLFRTQAGDASVRV